MSKRKGFIASGIAAIGLLLSAAAADAQQPQRPLFVPGEIIVKFEDGVGAATKAAVLSRNGVFVIRQLRGIDALYGALPAGIDLMAAKARLESLPQVRYAEPNYYRYINAAPNDPGFPLMWGLDNTGQTGGTPDADIDAPEGWNIETGSHDVILAVIDSGTDIDHEDLAANIYVNPGEYGVAGELANNGIDDDGNGFIDDVRGWDFRSGDNDVRDNSPACVGHGTHTAGTAGAVGNNAVGVTGVARNVSILPIRALGPILGILCGANDADLIDAINYAALMGADVSNNSWGGSGGSKAVRDAIAAARHVFVAAAGNEGNNNDSKPSYPASYKLDNIVAVAATDDNDLLPSFSNYGATSVDLAAPGVDILSTLPGDSYGQLSGTSMATPHVAGAAAVLLSAHPELTVAEVKDRLLRGTDYLGLPVATGGRLNLNGTLQVPDSPLVVTLTPVGSTTVLPGQLITFDVSVENTSASLLSVEASVRAWAPNGAQVFLVAPLTINVGAGAVLQTTVSETVPLAAPSGDYQIIGRVSNGSNVFEEEQLVYTVN